MINVRHVFVLLEETAIEAQKEALTCYAKHDCVNVNVSPLLGQYIIDYLENNKFHESDAMYQALLGCQQYDVTPDGFVHLANDLIRLDKDWRASARLIPFWEEYKLILEGG